MKRLIAARLGRLGRFYTTLHGLRRAWVGAYINVNESESGATRDPVAQNERRKTMGWETRGGRQYYYTAKRVGGRVIKYYVGAAAWAPSVAYLDYAERRDRADQESEARRQKAAALALDRQVQAFCDDARRIAEEALNALGYHRHDRGAWRRRREDKKEEAMKETDTIEDKPAIAQKPKPVARMSSRELVATDADQRQEIFKRAQTGDAGVLPQLRAALDERFPNGGIIPVADETEAAFLKAMYGDNLLAREDTKREMRALRARLAGPSPSDVERLLVERIVLCWLQTHYLEHIFAQNMGGQSRAVVVNLLQERADKAQRRYLSAIKTLAQVRRLQLPTVQVNVAAAGGQQINVAQSGQTGVV